MTKKDLAKTIADELNLSGLVALQAVQRTFEGITEALVEEGRIELRNFGVFEVKKRKPRKARNPRTGRESESARQAGRHVQAGAGDGRTSQAVEESAEREKIILVSQAATGQGNMGDLYNALWVDERVEAIQARGLRRHQERKAKTGGTIMAKAKPAKTISDVFEEFLTDQKGRISDRTFSKYEDIIDLYKSYLESYWPDHDDEYDKITKAGGTYCDTFSAEDATSGYSEFLGYFMPSKVMGGKETMKAAGTVTKKLAKWLVEKGYIKDTELAQGRADEPAKNLPKAQEVLELLETYLEWNLPDQHGKEIQDHFWIERIEPGKLWLNPMTEHPSVIGPVPVPEEVTNLCQPRWDIGGIVAKVGKGWRLLEVWNVSP